MPEYPAYGQQLVITCPLEANPPASYQWYFRTLKDNGFFSDDEMLIHQDYLNISLLNNNRTLYFDSVKEEHNGEYDCIAENSLGNGTFTNFPRVQVNSK